MAIGIEDVAVMPFRLAESFIGVLERRLRTLPDEPGVWLCRRRYLPISEAIPLAGRMLDAATAREACAG
jgi:hypothetical protein